MTGYCLVDLEDSVVSDLACPECFSGAIECTTAPHAHRCLSCGLSGLVYRNEDGLWESDD
jgi:hypothetical protein